MNFPQITTLQFYKYGIILFLISVLGSIINISIQWAYINIGIKISLFGNLLFQILLLILFIGLYIQTKKQEQTTVIENPEIDKFLKELQEKDILDNNQSNKPIKKPIIKNNSLKNNLKGGIEENGRNIN